MPTDWTTIRSEYVHGNDSQRELAAKHSVNPNTLMQNAMRGKWEADRKQFKSKVSAAAEQRMLEIQTNALLAYNTEDLEAAKKIRLKAMEMLEKAASPHDVRSIGGSVETASKVARLALGAATENQAVTTTLLPASVEEFV
jgi:transposase-like protein